MLTSSNRLSVFDAIVAERAYQDEKWGTIKDNPHTIPEWILIMEKELAEAKAAYFQRPADREMLDEIRQVIAVGVACLEQHGVVERIDPDQIEWYCDTCKGRGVFSISVDADDDDAKMQKIFDEHTAFYEACMSTRLDIRMGSDHE